MQSVRDDSDVPEEEDLIGAQLRPGAVDAAVELCAVLRMAEEARAPADGRRQRPRELRLRTPQPQEQQEERGGHREKP